MIPKPVLIQILKTICICIIVFCSTLVYRGLIYGNVTLYIANKAFADTALIILGLVVLTGPIARIYPRFSFLMMYRKWFGMSAFLISYIHGITTLYYLPEIFPLSRFHLGNWAFLCAMASLFILIWLFLLSFDFIIGSMNRRVWWLIHNWGLRLSFTFAGLHLLLLRDKNWITWMFFWIFSVRFIELLGKPLARKLIPVSLLCFSVIMLATFFPFR